MASELSKFIDDELLRQGGTPRAGRHAHASPPPMVRPGSAGLDGELSCLIEEEMTRSSTLNGDGHKRRRHALGVEAVKQLEGKSERGCCSARTLLFALLGFGMLMLLIVFISGHSGGGEYDDDYDVDHDTSEGLKRRPAGISDPTAMFGLEDEDFSDLYDAYADYDDDGEDDIGAGDYYADDYEEGELDEDEEDEDDEADDDDEEEEDDEDEDDVADKEDEEEDEDEQDDEDDSGDDDAEDDGSGDGDGEDEEDAGGDVDGGDEDDGDAGR